MKRALLIGSGNRMRYGIIPAFWCLRDSFTIASIVSRTTKRLSLFHGAFEATTTTSLSEVDMSALDLIIMAVTTNEAAGILRELSKRDVRHVTLMLDTPVLPIRHVLAARCFRNFKAVTVAEDSIALPPFLLAKQILEGGTIGSVVDMHFFHNAFRYHALAAMRMFAGMPLSITGTRAEGGLPKKKIFRFRGAHGVLYEPMAPRGTFCIQGERACIADFNYETPLPLYRIQYREENGVYRGLLLDGKEVPTTPHDRLFAASIDRDVFEPPETKASTDYTFLNSMKVRALVDMISATFSGERDLLYSPQNALFDALAMNIAERLGWYHRVMPLTLLLRALR
ncbi:hypothetical protein HY414_00795 [Candidatus Kaiserbacteria bacterium]|nr:hypothetical protein [Candidatus Kaiserbacteria bacterium]